MLPSFRRHREFLYICIGRMAASPRWIRISNIARTKVHTGAFSPEIFHVTQDWQLRPATCPLDFAVTVVHRGESVAQRIFFGVFQLPSSVFTGNAEKRGVARLSFFASVTLKAIL